MKRACDSAPSVLWLRISDMLTCFLVCAGEFYRRRDQRDDGQEAEHPQHVRHRSRRSRQVDVDGLAGVEGRYHRRSPRRRDSFHRYSQG